MKENDAIAKDIKRMVIKNPDLFPLVAHYWEISIREIENKPLKYLEFGKYEAASSYTTPFYKSFSKVINLDKLY